VTWFDTNNPSVAGYFLQDGEAALLILSHLRSSAQTIVVPAEYRRTHVDVLWGVAITLEETTSLQPYSFVWLQVQT
jgi:hypothetical protein